MGEALPQKALRCHIRLRGAETFADDLGPFGQFVEPRYNAFGKARGDVRKAEEEDWCLRRLLIAWKRDARMAWPCDVMSFERVGGEEGLPDFLIQFGDDEGDLGVEVTKATSQSWQKELADDEKTAATGIKFIGGDDGWGGDSPERQAVAEIFGAINHKIDKHAEGNYAATKLCDLLVHVNSETSVFIKPQDIVKRLGADARSRKVLEAGSGFRQVHILFGNDVALDVFGNTQRVVSIATMYEHDFVQWCEHEAALAQAGDATSLDLPNLAEELRSLGNSERRARDSHLKNLLLHLLKWFYQPDKRSPNWLHSIANARDQLDQLMETSPNLGRPEDLRSVVEKQYPKARRDAKLETGLPLSTFPNNCPFTLEQIRDPDFPEDLAE